MFKMTVEASRVGDPKANLVFTTRGVKKIVDPETRQVDYVTRKGLREAVDNGYSRVTIELFYGGNDPTPFDVSIIPDHRDGMILGCVHFSPRQARRVMKWLRSGK